jgi:hypothetical protein
MELLLDPSGNDSPQEDWPHVISALNLAAISAGGPGSRGVDGTVERHSSG